MIKSTKSNFWGTVANLILRNRLLILITISVMTLFLASQWQNMRFTYTEANLLPDTHPENIQYEDFIKTFGEEGNLIVIALKDDNFFTEEIFNEWVKLNNEINKFSEIDFTISTNNVQELIKDENQKKFILRNLLPNKKIDTVVLSTQHSKDVTLSDVKDFVMEEIIKTTIPKNLLSSTTKIHINPTGNFVIGGPNGDCGLTGRKIIVDTYGGMARHGGGAFSGKDPSKVDRSAAYMARYIAKNIVATKLADKCEIQLSYAIGVAEPTSISVNTFGTSKIENSKISSAVSKVFNLTPKGIIDTLDLLNVKYQPTAAFGHFGRDDKNFTWEQRDKVDILINELG